MKATGEYQELYCEKCRKFANFRVFENETSIVKTCCNNCQNSIVKIKPKSEKK